MYDIFLVGKFNNHPQVLDLRNKFPYIKIVPNFEKAKQLSMTEMFWVVWDDLLVDNHFEFDYIPPDYDKIYVHLFKNELEYNGIALFPKDLHISKRELEYRFFTNHKQIDQLSSRQREKLYDKHYISTYKDYQTALNSDTEMFWLIPEDIEIIDNSIFDLYLDPDDPRYDYDRNINHVFLNNSKYDGIILASKNKIISEKEFNNNFLVERKEWDKEISRPKLYDIFFISYNEINADNNWKNLKSRFPRAKRIHGVKGIHQAHIRAATESTTSMFWVIDGDSIATDNFNFDTLIPKYDRDAVFIWYSQNPINNLVYGYGGVKLLPKALTMQVNINSTDMTTSISKKFNIVQEVSNYTMFNTDPFSAWRSAFRECVKLSSKIINNQYDQETLERHNSWCTLNENIEYGFYAYLGALAGRKYGETNASNIKALNTINDFNWLRDFWLKEKSQILP